MTNLNSLKILPGRRPIIQIAERPILQQPRNIIQAKTRSTVSIPDSSIILESSGHHDKVIPVIQLHDPTNNVRA